MDDERTLSQKVNQVIQLTGCSEDLAAIILHDYNYEVAKAVNHLLDSDSNDRENVITTKHRNIRKSAPSTGPGTDGNECVTVLETSEHMLRKMKLSTEDENRNTATGDVKRDASSRRGRGRVRRNKTDAPKQNSVTRQPDNVEKEAEGADDEADGAKEHTEHTNGKPYPSRNRRPPQPRGNLHPPTAEGNGLPEDEVTTGRRNNRFPGGRGGGRGRGGLHRGGGFRNVREEGRVFSRREPPPGAARYRERDENYRQEADGWDATGVPEEATEEVPSWSGEPMVLTNSSAAAQCVDQLLDANDASMQCILSQYTVRASTTTTTVSAGTDGAPTATTPEVQQEHANRHNLNLPNMAPNEEEKVDWTSSWATSPTPAAKTSIVSTNPLQAASQTLKDMIGVSNANVQPTQTQAHPSVTPQVNPEDPEVLRRGIFQRPQRSKPPPQPQRISERPADLPTQLRPEPLGSYTSGFRFGDDDLTENYLLKPAAVSVISKLPTSSSTAIHGSHATATMAPKEPVSSSTGTHGHSSTVPSSAASQHPIQQHRTPQDYTKQATLQLRQQLGLNATSTETGATVRSPPQVAASNTDKSNHEIQQQHPPMSSSQQPTQPPQQQQQPASSAPGLKSSSSSVPSASQASSQEGGHGGSIQNSPYTSLEQYERSGSSGLGNVASNSPPSNMQTSGQHLQGSQQAQSSMHMNAAAQQQQQQQQQRLMPTPLLSSSYIPSTISYNQSTLQQPPVSQFAQPVPATVQGGMPQLDLNASSALFQALTSYLSHPQLQHMQAPIMQALLQQAPFYSGSGGNPSPPMNTGGVAGGMSAGSHPPGMMPPHTATGGYVASNLTPQQAMQPNMMNFMPPQATTAQATAVEGTSRNYYGSMAPAHHYYSQQQQHHMMMSAAAQNNSNASMGLNSGEQQQSQIDESNIPASVAEQQRNALSGGSSNADKYSNLKHMFTSPMKQQGGMSAVNNSQAQSTTNSGANSLFASSSGSGGPVSMDYHHSHHAVPQGGLYIPPNVAGNNGSAGYHHHPGMAPSFVPSPFNTQSAPQPGPGTHYLPQAVLMQPTVSVGGPKMAPMQHNQKNVAAYSAWMNPGGPNTGANASGNN